MNNLVNYSMTPCLSEIGAAHRVTVSVSPPIWVGGLVQTGPDPDSAITIGPLVHRVPITCIIQSETVTYICDIRCETF